MHRLIVLAGFQSVWFVSVICAANALYWPGPVIVILWLLLYAWRSGLMKQELTLGFISGAIGFFVDTAFIWSEAFIPKGIYGSLRVSPAWMIGLWLNFATSLNSVFYWLKGRYLLAAFLGFFGGPAAYYSGASLGAAVINHSFAYNLVLIGLGWSISLPLLIWLSEKIRPIISTNKPLARGRKT
jgi:hypothetical protein